MKNVIIGYRILNRGGKLPDDGWYHVVPVGEYPHPKAGMQVLDRKSLDAMVNAFREDETELGEHFPGLLVDFDHFSNDPKAPSEAAGWIQDLQNRTDQKDPKDNGLWAQIDWSDIGEKAVTNKRYRLTSPVWNPDDCEKIGEKRIRPLRLDRVAITNDPNLKGMNPLTNRGEDERTEKPADETAPETSTRRAAIKNDGTSEGAKKGWITRRGGAAGPVARMATKSDLAEKKPSVAEAPKPADRAATRSDLAKARPGAPPPGSVLEARAQAGLRSGDIKNHPEYRRAINQGASPEEAARSATADDMTSESIARMQRNADEARRKQPIKLIQKPAMPRAAVKSDLVAKN